jgi:hypothetical protein
MMHETMTREEAAPLLLEYLARFEWRIRVDGSGRLHVIVGDDPPRLTQRQVFMILDALAPALIKALAERDGLGGVDGGSRVH